MSKFLEILTRIATALERTDKLPAVDFSKADAFVWDWQHQYGANTLDPVYKISRLDIKLLQAIEAQRDTLLANTQNFVQGLPANNALLWGAPGMGKSSLVKAVHQKIAAAYPNILKLIEIHREDIASLPSLLNLLRHNPNLRFIVFCDDLSFEPTETSYKSLKTVLEGGIEGRPENVLFYATSNRRHLIARTMSENEDSTALIPAETAQEKISLSDRFGLWLGFHQCSQQQYLDMIKTYAQHFDLKIDFPQLRAAALEWSITRGGRSGRVAWQFTQDLAGKLGHRL